MEIAPGDQDDLCLLWEEEFGVEYPTIGKEGGSHDFTWMYGIIEQPHYAIIAPDHTIAYTTGLNNFYIESFQSIKDAFDLFGIEKHQCDNVVGGCDAPTNLKIINNGDRLSLSWDGSDDDVNYKLYWEKATDIPFYYYSETTETYIDMLPYMARFDNGYYVVSQCADGSESISDTITIPGNIALDYALVDCHGNPVRVFDILDRGQYIFIDCFFWHCDGCREIMPYVEEAYTYYGCNRGDVFFMEITNQDHDDKCLLWEEEFDVHYPTIGLDGGSFDYMNLYGINMYPSFIIISPDHTIVYTTIHDNFMITSFQSIKDAFDLFGIEEHPCDFSVDEENVMSIDVFPNPADGFVTLTTEGQCVIQVYNAMGQIVDSFVAENEQVQLVTEHYPNGLYFVQMDGKGYGRFVVSH